MPFHIYLPLRLLLLSACLSLIVFFPLHLAISLVSFLLRLSLIPCIFPGTLTFYMLLHIFLSLSLFLSHPALLSCTFHLSPYPRRSGSKSISAHKPLKPQDVSPQSTDVYSPVRNGKMWGIDRYLTFPGNFTWLIIAGNLKAANNHYFIRWKKGNHYK